MESTLAADIVDIGNIFTVHQLVSTYIYVDRQVFRFGFRIVFRNSYIQKFEIAGKRKIRCGFKLSSAVKDYFLVFFRCRKLCEYSFICDIYRICAVSVSDSRDVIHCIRQSCIRISLFVLIGHIDELVGLSGNKVPA